MHFVSLHNSTPSHVRATSPQGTTPKALAKAFAEICQTMLNTGQAAGWADYKASWQHSRTVMLAANADAPSETVRCEE